MHKQRKTLYTANWQADCSRRDIPSAQTQLNRQNTNMHVAQGRHTGRHSRALSEQNLMHLWVAMLLSCRLAQVCQLSSDEEDSDRDTEDSLSQEEQQVLLGAVTVLALHHLECQEYSPQDQQLDHLQDMRLVSGNCWKRCNIRNNIVAGSSVQRPASCSPVGWHTVLMKLPMISFTSSGLPS